MKAVDVARSVLGRPWVAGAIVALAVRLPNLRDGFDNDVAIYLTGGFAWARGDLPYRDLFDHKGPFNAELFAALDWLLPASPVALRLAMFAVFVASLAQLASLVARHSPAAAWSASVIYAIAASSPLVHGHDLNTEHWALPLIIAAADLADRARLTAARVDRERVALMLAAGAGVAIALAAGLKSIYLLAAAPVPALLVVSRPRLVAAMAGGSLVAAAAILLPFAISGTLRELGDAILGYSREFAGERLGAVFDDGPGGFAEYLVETPDLLLPAFALALGAIAARVESLRRPAGVAGIAVLGGWLVARLPGESYLHYFALPLPGLAVLCGLGVAALCRGAPDARWLVTAVVCFPIAAVLGLGPMRDALTIEPERRWGDVALPCVGSQDEAAEAVAELTEPGDRIYVATGTGASYFGQQIYWQARRLPASRFIFPRDVVPPAYAEVAADLERTPPAAVVLMPDPVMEPVAAAVEAGGLESAARIDCGGGAAIEVLA